MKKGLKLNKDVIAKLTSFYTIEITMWWNPFLRDL